MTPVTGGLAVAAVGALPANGLSLVPLLLCKFFIRSRTALGGKGAAAMLRFGSTTCEGPATLSGESSRDPPL